jgi:hypothetical protein
MSDGSLLASLPFALRAAAMDEGSEAGANAPSLATAAMKGQRPEGGSASTAGGVLTANVGRLIADRAFHFGGSALASRGLAIDGPFEMAGASGSNLAPQAVPSGEGAPAVGFQASRAMPDADVVPSSDGTSAAARTSIALHAGGAPSSNRTSPARAGTHSGRRPEISALPPVARAASSAQTVAPAASSDKGKASDGRLPDPAASAAPSTAQADPFGTQLTAAFAAGPTFEPDASKAGATAADIAPRASALAAGAAPSSAPVKEIDVDLSPGGLENVSMTMRLAGEKLSVVIRAGSSRTLSSIEGARDVIADRLAAIGQPLDSLIVKQTGPNTDGNTNTNTASAEDSSAESDWRSAHSAGERDGSNDALARRSAGRDRGF